MSEITFFFKKKKNTNKKVFLEKLSSVICGQWDFAKKNFYQLSKETGIYTLIYWGFCNAFYQKC